MERVMTELALYFSAKENVEIHLVLYGNGRDVFYVIPDSVQLHKPDWLFNNSYRFFYTFRTIFWLRRTLKKINPHTVLSFGEYWNSFVLLALKGTPYPVYVSDRCRPDKYLGKLHEFLRKWLYPSAAGLIAQTGKAKGVYTDKNLNKNIEVIGNPIRKISRNEKNTKKENIILTVGRLIDTKHHDRLIEIFDKIETRDWKLVIVGGNAIKQDGMSHLKTLIKKKNLQDRVTLTGTISDVDSYYLKSKIFAFTSSSEGFPNVIGEAMSAGLPVVSYDCFAGPADMIDDEKNGYLIDLFDDETFYKRLRKLMDDDELRHKMGRKSKKLIKRFSDDSIHEKYHKFITETI
jgi:glycosyltransferase involved in cell wall biosynthesis